MDNKIRCGWHGTDPLYVEYHDKEWGRPEYADQKLFEMLILETMQAGLSWITILKKREAYRQALDNFDVQKIVLYDQKKIDELMQNPGIVRNKLKIQSIIHNSKLFLEIQAKYGSFSKFLWAYVQNKPIVNKCQKGQVIVTSPISDQLSKDLKKMGFKFLGSTTIYAYMQAIGMVNDHLVDCFVYQELASLDTALSL